MKRLRRILCVVLLMCQALCAVAESGEENQMDNIILDADFSQGAWIYSPAKPMRMTGKLPLSDSEEDPEWLLTQWNSKNNIRGTQAQVVDGAYIYENEYKTVARDAQGVLTLRVNASEEYHRVRTSKMDSWVHLYFEQRYANPYPLAGMGSAPLRLSFCVPEFRDATPEGELDPSLHAAIAVFYVILKDMNPQSPAYGDFINFCVMLYDNRTPVTPESLFVDSGQNPIDATNMMIYTMDSSTYAGEVYADGVWHDIDIDLMPYFQHALRETQERGYMAGTKMEDLCISSVFFGFEVPGVMDCELRVRDLSLGLKPVEE